jgi:raffinose/stachyose/melibiose transport system substrate-binding protein
LSDEDAPDVVQANNSRSEMGQYVGAGLLVPLDDYAEAYGWFDRYPQSVRALASYSEDGSVYGEGQLYGLPQMGEIVGLFYNKTKLDELGVEPPATTDAFVAAVEAAQEAGEVPVQFGNSEGWPGIHEYGFVQNQYVDADTIRDLGRRRLQRDRLRHRVAELRAGRRRVLRRRHLARRRPRRRDGRRGGIRCLLPAQAGRTW